MQHIQALLANIDVVSQASKEELLYKLYYAGE